jgi:hypothetical protein
MELEFVEILKFPSKVSLKQKMPNLKIFQREKELSLELMEVLLAMKPLDTEFLDHSSMKN